jgi:hypothetical protein
VNIFKFFFCLILSSTYLFITSWSFCFGFSISYILFVIIPIGIILKHKPKRKNIFRNSILIGYVIFFLFFPFTLKEYNNKSEFLQSTIDKGLSLSFKDKLGIYGLNLILGIVGYPLYPEVSKETLLLSIPCMDDKRVFSDDFFLSSEKIKNEIKKMTQLNHPYEKRILWNMSEYSLGKKEARYALALNPCTLKVINSKDHSEISVSVRVQYPEKTTAILLNKPFLLKVEEGLFGYLQKEGWLFPYEAEYKILKRKL